MRYKPSSTSIPTSNPDHQKVLVIGIWRRILNKYLKIGFQEGLPRLDKNRLITVNALCAVLLVALSCFLVVFYLVGMHNWYYIAPAFPIYIAVLIANSVHKHKLAQYLLYFGSLSLLTFLSITNRRVGAEYGLIAVACSVPMMSRKNVEVYLLFILSALAFIVYKAYDYFLPFVPDPAINYPVASTIALLVSATAILIQSLLFRDMVSKFSDSLKGRNQVLIELIDSKEEIEKALEQKNKDLNELTDQLNWIVNQKTKELQTYIDAININICSSIIDMDGDFIKVNEPFVKLSGYSEEELIGKNLRMLDSGNPDTFINGMQISLESHRTWRGEVKNVGKEGAIFWTDQMIIPMKIKDDHISYFLMLAFPITQRKLMEESREKTRVLLENIAFQTSHKIRGPLARIQGLTGLVQKDFIKASELKNVTTRLISCLTELNLATSDLVQFVEENQNFIEGDRNENKTITENIKNFVPR